MLTLNRNSTGETNAASGRRRRITAPACCPLQLQIRRLRFRATERIEQVELAALRGYERNARIHSPKQVTQLAASIRQFGFVNPILVDARGQVVAGHGRLAAAKHLGLEHVPTIRVDHLTEEQLRAYRIADNRLAELSDWDEEFLALELQDLCELELRFRPGGGRLRHGRDRRADRGLDTDGDESRSRRRARRAGGRPVGELWQLGPHRLSVRGCPGPRVLRPTARHRAGAAACSPIHPTTYRINGHVCGLGKTAHREFAMASGEMSRDEFIQFLRNVLGHMAAVSQDGAIHFVFMDWAHAYDLLQAGHEVYAELKNICVWAKTNAGMGSFYRSQHELVFAWKHGTAPHINNFKLGETGRYRTNVWEYAGLNTFRRGRAEELSSHPTVKPVALVMDAIKDCSRRGGLVLDAFGGSGTTLIAAHRTGRVARLLEIDPLYVDVIIRRWEALTGEQASHAESGRSFAERALALGCTASGEAEP